jgi:polysaccharide pyruvyl transferase WcaK-like protein
MQAVAPLGTVVATRYHNVICALKLCKPTISLGYSPKFASLMADMGLPDFSQVAHSLDVDRLIEQFTQLQSHSAQVRLAMAARNAAKKRELDQQFAALNAVLFPAGAPVPAAAVPSTAGEGAR